MLKPSAVHLLFFVFPTIPLLAKLKLVRQSLINDRNFKKEIVSMGMDGGGADHTHFTSPLLFFNIPTPEYSPCNAATPPLPGWAGVGGSSLGLNTAKLPKNCT
jgi:hypothetical protein